MVKKLEFGKSYELAYKIFVFKPNFLGGRKFMFYGSKDDAIAEFNVINKKFDNRGGMISEVDLESGKVRRFKRLGKI